MSRGLVRKCSVCAEAYVDKNSTWQRIGFCSSNCYIQPRVRAINNALKIKAEAPVEKTPPKNWEAKKKRKEMAKSRRSNRGRKLRSNQDTFYQSEAWLDIRYRVLKKYGPTCMLCHTVKGSMHVDHIQPRSKRHDLQLRFDNLQVLCKDCNKGKSNRDNTDFRPKDSVTEDVIVDIKP